MGSIPILCVNISITIDTKLKFEANAAANVNIDVQCERTLTRGLLCFLAGDVRGGPVPHRRVGAAVHPRVEGGAPALPEGRHRLQTLRRARGPREYTYQQETIQRLRK